MTNVPFFKIEPKADGVHVVFYDAWRIGFVHEKGALRQSSSTCEGSHWDTQLEKVRSMRARHELLTAGYMLVV